MKSDDKKDELSKNNKSRENKENLRYYKNIFLASIKRFSSLKKHVRQ